MAGGKGNTVISLGLGGAMSLMFRSVAMEIAGMAYRWLCWMIILMNDIHSWSESTNSETYSEVLSTRLPSQSILTSQLVTVSTAW